MKKFETDSSSLRMAEHKLPFVVFCNFYSWSVYMYGTYDYKTQQRLQSNKGWKRRERAGN
jgi:hypothetical protein